MSRASVSQRPWAPRRPRASRWASAALVAAAGATLLVGPGAAAPAAAESAAEPSRLEVGQEAPDFTLESSEGGTFTLSEMKDRKSIVLIFFRGTW